MSQQRDTSMNQIDLQKRIAIVTGAVFDISGGRAVY
jgi:hypothetical protein